MHLVIKYTETNTYVMNYYGLTLKVLKHRIMVAPIDYDALCAHTQNHFEPAPLRAWRKILVKFCHLGFIMVCLILMIGMVHLIVLIEKFYLEKNILIED